MTGNRSPRIVAGLLMALLLGACTPDTRGVRLIGHGGSGTESTFPMNSFASLREALEHGLDGIELDVQMTRDSVLVAHHALEMHGEACAGRINDHTWQELASCAQPNGPEGTFHGVRVDSLLAYCAARYPQAEFTFDIKLNTAGDWWTYLHSFCRGIAALHRSYGLADRLLVECQTGDLLKAMSQSAPGIATFYYATEAEGAVAEAQALGCRGITMEVGGLSTAQAERIHRAGLELTVFGVGGPWALRRALALRPSRIQVDR